MEDINYLLRVLTLSQVLLTTGYLIFFQRHRTGVLATVLSISIACYLVMPFLAGYTTNWFLLPIAVTVVIPSILWLLVRWLFCDDTAIPGWFVPVTASYLIITLVPRLTGSQLTADPQLAAFLFFLVPQLVKLGFVVHAIYIALTGIGSDLVESRLPLRKPLALSLGTIIGLVILVEIWAGEVTPVLIEVLGSGLMFALSLAANLKLLEARKDLTLLLKPDLVTPVPATDELSAHARSVTSAMLDERFYATHGITLADLGKLLNVPVHRLRRTINQELGYRNFNQFLNFYRIEEASRRLLEEEELPILTIALDVGFKSLSSFNTAFKQARGMTPSDFRLTNV